MLTESILAEIVKQALQQHNPQEYERLKADGSLDVVAKLRAEAAIETLDELMDRARDQALVQTSSQWNVFGSK